MSPIKWLRGKDALKNILTVLIPTYNRKKHLFETLEALQNQTILDFDIVISDNASNYSIEEELLPLLSKEIVNKIIIYHRPYNIGGDSNIAGLFSLCNTKWAWLLGDDDKIKSNAIEIILKNIIENPDIGGFWYSLVKQNSNSEMINSLEQYVELQEKLSFHGDAIFLSNKICNMEIAKKYIYQANVLTYTSISQCIPIFEMLKEHIEYMVIFNNLIVEHGFDEGITWNVAPVSLGMETILDYNTGMNWEYHKRFVKCMTFSFKFLLRYYLENENLLKENINFLKRHYYNCYKYILNFQERFIVKIIIYIASTKFGFHMMKKAMNIFFNAKSD